MTIPSIGGLRTLIAVTPVWTLVFAHSAHALPPEFLARTKASASLIASECAPERRDEIVERFQKAVVDVVGPPLDAHHEKVVRAQAAVEKAGNDYAACIKAAREKALVPKEACATEAAQFRERERVIRVLRSRDTLEGVTRQVAPAFEKALQPLEVDFPACDFRRLKVIAQ